VEEWDADAEWAPHLAALCWRGTPDVLEAVRGLMSGAAARERAVAAYVLGQLGVPSRRDPAASDAALAELAAREDDPGVLAAIAHAYGNLGEPHGTAVLLALAGHEDAAVRFGVAQALGGRDDPQATQALVGLAADPDPEVREWAAFALGTLAEADGPEIRDALGRLLDDPSEAARTEAVHGLALRGDLRAVEPALELLAGRAREEGLWRWHALEVAAVRLAALSGDARFASELPPPERYAGTVLERELRRAHERMAASRSA
jgi:HEAT repeat protein